MMRNLAVAAAVILAAAGLGLLHLAASRIPANEEALRAWVTEALGLELGFERLDARLRAGGPELTFHGATIGGPAREEPFLSARRAHVRLDVLRLIRERRLAVDRLTLDGTRLVLVREPDGALRLQGLAIGPMARTQWIDTVPAAVELTARDSEVVYLERDSGTEWVFSGVTATLTRAGGALVLEARGTAPAALAGDLELSAVVGVAAGGGDIPWSLSGTAGGLDLAALASFLPRGFEWPLAGSGGVSAAVAGAGRRVTAVALELALEEVGVPVPAGEAGVYRRVAASAAWRREQDGWRAVLDDLVLERGGHSWPLETRMEAAYAHGAAGPRRLALRSESLRLEDLTPALGWILTGEDAVWFNRWLAAAPRGVLRGLELELLRSGQEWAYTAAAKLEDVAMRPAGDWPGFSGLSGELWADSSSGRATIDARDAELEWPQVLPGPITASLTGLIAWRQGRDGLRVVADDLVLANADGVARGSFALGWPRGGASPHLDLAARVSAMDAVAVNRYLPIHRMPQRAVRWLDDGIRGGRVRGAEVSFSGALREFPFAAGEGSFEATVDVEEGILEFMPGWPRAEALHGTLVFRNAGFEAHADGLVLGSRAQGVRVRIPDLREPALELGVAASGPSEDLLAFVRGASLLAEHLGPDLRRLAVSSGIGAVDIDLTLPLRDPAAFDLSGTVDLHGATLVLEGWSEAVTGVTGTLRLGRHRVVGEGLRAQLLDGPITARLAVPGPSGYRLQLDLDGEVSSHAVVEAFNLPFGKRVAGRTQYRGSVLVPPRSGAAGTEQPLRINVASALSGVAMVFPPPFAKMSTEATSLRLDAAYAEGRGLELRGALGALSRVALSFEDEGAGLRFRRGAVRFGGEAPELPADPGLVVDGELAVLGLDDWASVARAASLDAANLESLLLGADLRVGSLTALGQPLGASRLEVSREPTAWRVALESEPAAGVIAIPRDVRAGQVHARMERLHLVTGGRGRGLATLDPRALPGLALEVETLSFGPRRFGRVRAEVAAEPAGLRLVSFDGRTGSFAIDATGGWFVEPEGMETRLVFTLLSDDLAASLAELGFARVAEARGAELRANVRWPGAPSEGWADDVRGHASLRAVDGSLLDLEPGAGRVLGLMSITHLPRRLALDFRDVFNRGLVFDEITGDFALVEGNAYTDNLKLTGPVAEIGLAGRTGLRDRDYAQQAVVSAQPGGMLSTVGGLLGGPGVGAALLIFTQIFKEPLKGIGRASYCVTGGWEQPAVERLSAEQLQRGRFCAEMPSEGVSEVRR